jgi:tetratricopeptide (TPR) repeat protein
MPQGDVSESGELHSQLWNVLQLHLERKHDEALLEWSTLAVPPDAVIWKWIAVGQALTATGEFEAAEQRLGAAVELAPDNPVAFYFLGVLRLEQASFATEWPDVVGPKPTRLVGYVPRQVVPNTKGMYELAATAAFEKAIELAGNVHADEVILSGEYAHGMALEPTVGDLLFALGADNFPAKAHNALSYLFLERGALEVAENHLDEAVKGGLDPVYGYRELGDEYRVRGQFADATRAYLKATRFTPHKLRTLGEALRSLRDALINE